MKSCIILSFLPFLDYVECQSFNFTGSSTNCNDDEIEKYIRPGQTGEPPYWKEKVKMIMNLKLFIFPIKKAGPDKVS